MSDLLTVHIIPCLKDNYTYIVEDKSCKECVVVDPAEAAPIEKYIKEHGLKIKQIWITHFHSDHVGGLEELKKRHSCEVFGPQKEAEKIKLIDQTVGDLDLLQFNDHCFKVLELPGHTLGHVGYWLYNEKIFFCGDTLFSLGCGFLFEGDHKEMWNSLCKIRSLPEDTLIYCGHEYTEENGKFALMLDPDNAHLKEYVEWAHNQRLENKPTMPMLLKTEMYTNPFLRADLPSWREKLKMEDASALEIFKEIRERKDKFKS